LDGVGAGAFLFPLGITVSDLFTSIATSKPFRFTIGTTKREFTIHSALVASQSPALDRLVNGSFKEAQEYHAELESVDEETFALFVQYAYTGQYSAKKDKKRKGKISTWMIAEPEPQAAEVEYSDLTGFGMAKSWEKFKRKLLDLEILADEPQPQQQQPQLHGIPAMPQPLVSHARVFVFADFWGVVGLRYLALKNLGKYLEEVELTSAAKVEHVTSLLEFCYDETCPVPEGLKSLCVLYAASKITKLWKSMNFQEVFSNHPDLARSLMGAVVDP